MALTTTEMLLGAAAVGGVGYLALRKKAPKRSSEATSKTKRSAGRRRAGAKTGRAVDAYMIRGDRHTTDDDRKAWSAEGYDRDGNIVSMLVGYKGESGQEMARLARTRWPEAVQVDRMPGQDRRAGARAAKPCACAAGIRRAGQPIHFTTTKAREIGNQIGVDWRKVDLEQFRQGLAVEMEHRNVTHGNLQTTGRIALAHLKELPDYYTRLSRMEHGRSAGKRRATKAKPAARRAGTKTPRVVAPKIVQVAKSNGIPYTLIPAAEATLYANQGGHSGGLGLARRLDRGEKWWSPAFLVETRDGKKIALLYEGNDEWCVRPLTPRSRAHEGRSWHETRNSVRCAPTRQAAIDAI